jgi:hypothetical protein
MTQGQRDFKGNISKVTMIGAHDRSGESFGKHGSDLFCCLDLHIVFGLRGSFSTFCH